MTKVVVCNLVANWNDMSDIINEAMATPVPFSHPPVGEKVVIQLEPYDNILNDSGMRRAVILVSSSRFIKFIISIFEGILWWSLYLPMH